MPSGPARWYSIACAIAAVATSGCGGDDCCSPLVTIYYAVAYGTVTQAGQPARGVEVRGEVFQTPCPGSGSSEGLSAVQSEEGGFYRLVLSSTSQSPGQCLRLTADQATTVEQTLTATPFTSAQREFVVDSIRIDIELP